MQPKRCCLAILAVAAFALLPARAGTISIDTGMSDLGPLDFCAADSTASAFVSRSCSSAAFPFVAGSLAAVVSPNGSLGAGVSMTASAWLSSTQLSAYADANYSGTITFDNLTNADRVKLTFAVDGTQNIAPGQGVSHRHDSYFTASFHNGLESLFIGAAEIGTYALAGTITIPLAPGINTVPFAYRLRTAVGGGTMSADWLHTASVSGLSFLDVSGQDVTLGSTALYDNGQSVAPAASSVPEPRLSIAVAAALVLIAARRVRRARRR